VALTDPLAPPAEVAPSWPSWNGRGPGFVEAWHLCVTVPGAGTLALRFRVVIGGAAEPTATVAAAFFDANRATASFGVQRTFPLAAAQTSAATGDEAVIIGIGPSRLTRTGARGAVAGGGHEVTWDLRWAPIAGGPPPTPSAWQAAVGLTQPRRTALADRLEVSGQVSIGRVRIELRGAVGWLDHAAGTRHTERWATARCALFDGAGDVSLEVYSVRPRQLGVPTPPVTIARLRQGSEVIDLGGAVSVARSRARWDAGVYRFDVVGVRHRLVGEVSCLPAQQLDYPLALPGGRAAHAAQAGNADVHVTIHRRGLRGFSTSRLVATGTALLEVGLASRDRLVPRSYHLG
jgi:hypothetical protein